ncbi:MAG TPA: hypothetical protein VJN94_10740 [Candidatus Binataceae bacterium]|nr:hypothetical protein [Candidatus Binataceae bacterium]
MAICGLALAGVAGAQDNPPVPVKSQQQLDTAAAKAERKAAVGQNMYLSPSQAKVFWPLYDAYEKRMDRIEDRHVREIKDYVATYTHLTDDAANHKLDEVIAILQARLDVQKEYVPKFRAALPGVVVTRFFQIDNKLRAMVQCNIAQMVPLAQPPPHAEHANQNGF